MTAKNIQSTSPRRDILFWTAILSIFLFTSMGIGVDIDQYIQHLELHIPTWYFYLIGSIDIVSLLSILLMFFFRKIGIYLFPVAILLHLSLHIYYLSTMLYTDLMALFLFTSVGLLYFIPVWKELK